MLDQIKNLLNTFEDEKGILLTEEYNSVKKRYGKHAAKAMLLKEYTKENFSIVKEEAVKKDTVEIEEKYLAFENYKAVFSKTPIPHKVNQIRNNSIFFIEEDPYYDILKKIINENDIKEFRYYTLWE